MSADEQPPPAPARPAAYPPYDATVQTGGAQPAPDVRNAPDTDGDQPAPELLVSPNGIWSLTLACAAIMAVATNILLSVWPAEPPVTGLSPVAMLWGAVTTTLSHEARLMIVVMFSGVLGSMVHAMTSLASFAGNRRLERSWLPWYLLRPFIGAALALLFYLVMRAGLLSAQLEGGAINPYGVAALAGLAGMFSKQASDKLNETFSTLFKSGPGSGDDSRGGKLPQGSSKYPTGHAANEGERVAAPSSIPPKDAGDK